MRTTESAGIGISVSEQFANAIEFRHNWGEKTRSGDNDMLGLSVEDTSGITWLVVTKLRGRVIIPPGGITFSVRRVKWILEQLKWRSTSLELAVVEDKE